MADRNLVLQLLITAKDNASATFGQLFSYLDNNTRVVANTIRAAFSNLFGGGMENAADFEAQLDRVAAKGNYTAEAMAGLERAALEMGAKFGISGIEAAKGMESLAAAGLSTADVINALPPVLALASAEALSMDEASALLVNSLTTIGLGFGETARLADVLTQAANESTTSAAAVGAALETAGGIARTAGLDLEQTVAALTALAKGGIEGEKAGTALQAILTGLLDPASAASKELSALGISSRDLGEVIAALKEKGDAANGAILAFGETAGPGLRGLLAVGQEGIAGLETAMRGATGATAAAAENMSDNLTGAMAALSAAWENVKTVLALPVLEPLAAAATAAAKALNEALLGGALKPVQEAIRTFANDGIAAARDFVAGFNFAAAWQALTEFANTAKTAFAAIRDSGKTAADVVSLSWNTLATGVKTIGAGLTAIAASTVQTLANIEAAASTIGLGTAERAAELKQTAADLAAKGAVLLASAADSGRATQAAFDRLTTSGDAAGAALTAAAAAAGRLGQNLPVEELGRITRTLDDYRGMAERAAAATDQARADMEAGKIATAEYGAVMQAAAAANAELATAIDRAAAAEKAASPQRQSTATELAAAAAAAKKAATGQGEYGSALDRALQAQMGAIQAEIDLARRRGDTATVTERSIALAELEADRARQSAEAKGREAAEVQKAADAQQAYLTAIGGGTEAQRQELDILQLKAVALGEEQKTQELVAASLDQKTAALVENTAAIKENADAVRENTGAWSAQQSVMEENEAATIRMAETMQQWRNESAAQGEAVSNVLGEWHDRLAALNPELATAFDLWASGTQDATAGMSELDIVIQRHNELVAGLSTAGNTGMVGYLNSLAAKAAELERAWIGEAEQAERFIRRLDAVGTSGGATGQALEGLIRQAQHSADSFTALDGQRLANLQAAIDNTNQKLRDMQQETEDARLALRDLDAQLLEAKGQQAQAALARQQLDYQQQLADLERQRQEAQATGNAELIRLIDRQIGKLNELNAVKIANIKTDEAAEKAAAKAADAAQTLASRADDLDRINGAMQQMAQQDLSALIGQFDILHQSVGTLRDAL